MSRWRKTWPSCALRAWAVFAIGAASLAFAPYALAQSTSAPPAPSLRSAAASIKQGNRLLDEGRYEEALAEYEKARAGLPDSAEIAYDRGIALYRLGRYGEAEKAFQDALEPGNLELEAKAKYNLGRSAHAAALEKKDNLPDAINDLGRAISFYNDALQIIKDDADAKLNKEAAERLRAYLEKLLAQQQQEQQQEQKDNATSQPNEEPTSQPDEPQPSSQPSEEEKNKQDQGQEGDQEQEGEQEQQSEQEGESKEAQQKKDQKGQSKNQDKPGQDRQGEQQKEAQAKGQEGKMSEEEAEPMLQEARDAERQRREANRMRMMRLRGRIPVERDW